MFPWKEEMSGLLIQAQQDHQHSFLFPVYSFLATGTSSLFRIKILGSEKACISGFRIGDNFYLFLRVVWRRELIKISWLLSPKAFSFSHTKSIPAHILKICQIQRRWVTKSSKVNRNSTRKISTRSCCHHETGFDFNLCKKNVLTTYQVVFLIRVMYSWVFTTLFSIPFCMSEIFHNKKFSSQNSLAMFSESWGRNQPLDLLLSSVGTFQRLVIRCGNARGNGGDLSPKKLAILNVPPF